MKKTIFVLLIAFLVVFSVLTAADDEIDEASTENCDDHFEGRSIRYKTFEHRFVIGQCVRECVQTQHITPGEGRIFRAARECAVFCRDTIKAGQDVCGYWEDGCCNADYPETDPDCDTVGLPSGAVCSSDSECASGVCDIPLGFPTGTCQ